MRSAVHSAAAAQTNESSSSSSSSTTTTTTTTTDNNNDHFYYYNGTARYSSTTMVPQGILVLQWYRKVFWYFRTEPARPPAVARLCDTRLAVRSSARLAYDAL